MNVLIKLFSHITSANIYILMGKKKRKIKKRILPKKGGFGWNGAMLKKIKTLISPGKFTRYEHYRFDTKKVTLLNYSTSIRKMIEQRRNNKLQSTADIFVCREWQLNSSLITTSNLNQIKSSPILRFKKKSFFINTQKECWRCCFRSELETHRSPISCFLPKFHGDETGR